MRKEKVIVSFACDLCYSEYDNEDDLRDHERLHTQMYVGRELTSMKNWNVLTGIVISVDHKHQKCLMEYKDQERLWISFYELCGRNGISFT